MSERDTEQLKARLAELESLYDRLLSEERSGENLDQRRLRILKSQNIQLERQVVALSDVLQARMEIIADVQNHALELKQALETASKQITPEEAHQLKAWATRVQSRLSRYESDAQQAMKRPYFMANSNPYLNKAASKKMTVLDVCFGSNTDHLNVHALHDLERHLSSLYKFLSTLHHTLSTIASLVQKHEQEQEEEYPEDQESSGIRRLQEKRATKQMYECASSLSKIIKEISTLGVLVPSSSLSPMKSSNSPQDSALPSDTPDFAPGVEDIMTKLNPYIVSIRSKQQDVSALMQSLVNCFERQRYVWNLDKEAMKLELEFLKECQIFQSKYTQEMFKSIDQARMQFNTELKSTLLSPLTQLVQSFEHFDTNSNEVSLRNFLVTFRTVLPQLESFVQSRQKQPKSSSKSAEIGVAPIKWKSFVRELEVIQHEYETKRDALLSSKFKLQQDLLSEPLFMAVSSASSGSSYSDIPPQPSSSAPIISSEPKREREREKERESSLRFSSSSSFQVSSPPAAPLAAAKKSSASSSKPAALDERPPWVDPVIEEPPPPPQPKSSAAALKKKKQKEEQKPEWVDIVEDSPAKSKQSRKEQQHQQQMEDDDANDSSFSSIFSKKMAIVPVLSSPSPSHAHSHSIPNEDSYISFTKAPVPAAPKASPSPAAPKPLPSKSSSLRMSAFEDQSEDSDSVSVHSISSNSSSSKKDVAPLPRSSSKPSAPQPAPAQPAARSGSTQRTRPAPPAAAASPAISRDGSLSARSSGAENNSYDRPVSGGMRRSGSVTIKERPSGPPVDPLTQVVQEVESEFSERRERLESLERELADYAVDMTAAQSYALKKKIAVEKAALAREERALLFLGTNGKK